jgi:hypothetical protein
VLVSVFLVNGWFAGDCAENFAANWRAALHEDAAIFLFEHTVTDADNWSTIARKHKVDAGALIDFNFGTRAGGKRLRPEEINWYLRELVGCRLADTKGGHNYSFRGADPSKSKIYIPPKEGIPKTGAPKKKKKARDDPSSYKKRILALLPRPLTTLPKKANRELDSGVIMGIMSVSEGITDRYQLIDQKRDGSSWGAPNYIYVADSDIDLLKTTFMRRGLMRFDKSYGHEGFRRKINKDLAGEGESNPVLACLLGLAMGPFGFTTGLIYTGLTTAMSITKDHQPIRVREGDVLQHIETVGIRNGKVEHQELIVLIDPFRAKAKRDVQQWIIHDKRLEVHLDK